MKFPLLLLLSLLAAYALSCILTIAVNPEVAFWNEAIEQRHAAITEIRKEQPEQPIIFFTGGSSCAFSIDPKIIEEECGLPAINLGLPVACGARYILHQALREARPGDLIVVCLEPDLLTYPGQESSPSKTGFTLEARRGNLTDAAGGSTFGENMEIPDFLTLSRPGANYLITLVGRTLTGKGYRYKTSDIKYHGLIQTPVREPGLTPRGDTMANSLHQEGRILLESFTAAAKEKDVSLAYSMPWHYTATASIDPNRALNREILKDIESIMPVIEDGYSGSMPGRENFSDSPLHLSGDGTHIRSRALAKALKPKLPTLFPAN